MLVKTNTLDTLSKMLYYEPFGVLNMWDQLQLTTNIIYALFGSSSKFEEEDEYNIYLLFSISFLKIFQQK